MTWNATYDRCTPGSAKGPPRGRARPQAFTLVEVILAVGIFAIVMVSINSAFFAAIRLRQRTSEALENALPLTQALALMRRDLQNAVPPGGTMTGNFRGGLATLGAGVTGSLNSSAAASKGAQSVLEVNRAAGLDFYTTTGKLSDAVPWADIQQVNYQLTQPDDPSKPGMELVRSVARNLLATASELAHSQKLAENIESLDFFFWDGLQWRDQWDTSAGDTALPLAVRVRIYQVPPKTASVRQEPLEMLVLLPATQSSTNSTTEVTQ
jgi:prepilin-type N-terminal cleavage/methylation domain-containing protein